MVQSLPWNLDSGTLTSPRFPRQYPSNLDSSYEISVSNGPIDLSFSHFDIDGYKTDYVTITDGDGTILLNKASGRSIPRNVTSKTDKVYVKFYSDDFLMTKLAGS